VKALSSSPSYEHLLGSLVAKQSPQARFAFDKKTKKKRKWTYRGTMTNFAEMLQQHSAPIDPRGGVEFVEMPVRQILNRCANPKMRFRWTINPYRGCEFGCVYCYARYTHEFLELRDPMDFERKIFIKRMAAEVLARTLSRTPIGDDQIAIGTATDPYQPAERCYGLTRSMLEVFAKLGGLDLSITTKSNLITRDIDVLKEINRRVEQKSRLQSTHFARSLWYSWMVVRVYCAWFPELLRNPILADHLENPLFEKSCLRRLLNIFPSPCSDLLAGLQNLASHSSGERPWKNYIRSAPILTRLLHDLEYASHCV